MKTLALSFAFTTTLFAAPYLWVTDDYEYLYVIDTGLNPPTVVQTITSISSPYGLGFTSDGKYCYVLADANPSKVYVINTSDYSFVTPMPITVGNAGTFLAVTDEYVYVANWVSNTISVISIETNEVIQTLSTGFNEPLHLAASPDGSYLYVVNTASPYGITVLEIPSNTLVGMPIATFPFTNNPYGIAFAPNGTAYVANSGLDKICVIAPDFTPSFITTGSLSYSIAVTPDGNSVYIINENFPYMEVIEVNNGNTIVPITSPAIGGSYCLAISPDGSSVYTFNGTTLNVTSTDVTHTVTSYPDFIFFEAYFGAFQPGSFPPSSPRSFVRPSNTRH